MKILQLDTMEAKMMIYNTNLIDPDDQEMATNDDIDALFDD